MKSADFITWEYVSQPDFPNWSKWENAVYLLEDKCYYFVRQQDDTRFGFLTVYDLTAGTWAKPVLIEDCQSRSDFIFYDGQLYLFHAPIDREHIGVVRIDRADIAKSEIVLTKGEKRRKDQEYYRLNIRPNDNETGTDFWFNVARELVATGDCVVVRMPNGKYYRANSYQMDDYVLFGYAIKLKLLERLNCFEQTKGKAEFNSLFEGIQQRVYSL